MEIQKHSGVMAKIIEAMQDMGDPSNIRRIQVTEAEMKEIVVSGVFRKTVATHYGGSDVPVFSNIETAADGSVISMYFGTVLICQGPPGMTPAQIALTYAPLTVTNKAETSFTVDVGGKKYMLVGIGNPADDFVLGKNADIELGLAVRKVNDATYYGDNAGGFDIEIEGEESWTFALTAGSLNDDIPLITDMYDISLYLDVDPEGTKAPVRWDLQYAKNKDGKGQNFVWYNTGTRIVDDSATNADASVTQMIQQYKFQPLNAAIPASVERTPFGVPLGIYTIKLEARPRFGTSDPVSVEVMANVTKKQ